MNPITYLDNKNSTLNKFKVENKQTSLNSIKTKLGFMDFCAGIGAGRLGLQNLGMECAAFSEIDKQADRTYREFFGKKEINYGDLTKVESDELPQFDLMIAGFPCQTFSVIELHKYEKIIT